MSSDSSPTDNAQVPTVRTPTTAFQQAGILGDAASNLLSGNLGAVGFGLQETAELSPDITRLAMEVFRNQAQGIFQQRQQDVVNRLEGLGALTGTTTGTELGRIEDEFGRQLAAVGGQAAIRDIDRALENRIRLTGLGGDFSRIAGGLDLGAVQAENQALQQRFENQLALASLEEQTGGLAGGLTGGIGGLTAGIALAPFTGGLSIPLALGLGAAGATAGALGPSGTGGSILTAGASAFGGSNPFLTSPIGSQGVGGNRLFNQSSQPVNRVSGALGDPNDPFRRLIF